MTTSNKANKLVPYKQDEEKWTKHFISQAMRQINDPQLTKKVKKGPPVEATVISSTAQIVAQAKSELKREIKNPNPPIYAPIKATPEFIPSHTSAKSGGVKTSKKRKHSSARPSKQQNKRSRDIFDSDDDSVCY